MFTSRAWSKVHPIMSILTVHNPCWLHRCKPDKIRKIWCSYKSRTNCLKCSRESFNRESNRPRCKYSRYRRIWWMPGNLIRVLILIPLGRFSIRTWIHPRELSSNPLLINHRILTKSNTLKLTKLLWLQNWKSQEALVKITKAVFCQKSIKMTWMASAD